MSLGDAQILDLKDAIVAAFRPMENLFVVMGSASVAEGGETVSWSAPKGTRGTYLAPRLRKMSGAGVCAGNWLA